MKKMKKVSLGLIAMFITLGWLASTSTAAAIGGPLVHTLGWTWGG